MEYSRQKNIPVIISDRPKFLSEDDFAKITDIQQITKDTSISLNTFYKIEKEKNDKKYSPHKNISYIESMYRYIRNIFFRKSVGNW